MYTVEFSYTTGVVIKLSLVLGDFVIIKDLMMFILFVYIVNPRGGPWGEESSHLGFCIIKNFY